MAKEAGADIIELNFSCPNTIKEAAGEIYHSPDDAAEIAAAVKKAVRIPVFAKIGYLGEPRLRRFVEATAASLDGLVAINTVSAPIERADGQPLFPGRSTAGLSGWVIRDVAHKVARDLVKIRRDLRLENDLCILGLGGVMNSTDYWERLDSGVDAVEICTGAFLDPLIGMKIRGAEQVVDNAHGGATGGLTLDKDVESFGEVRVPLLIAEKRDFEGKIIRRDPDGFGLVEFSKPLDAERPIGFFTFEVLQNPAIARKCVVGQRVSGRAVRGSGDFRVLHLEPLIE
jgi:tRNA-dihydrouridine synthase